MNHFPPGRVRSCRASRPGRKGWEGRAMRSCRGRDREKGERDHSGYEPFDLVAPIQWAMQGCVIEWRWHMDHVCAGLSSRGAARAMRSCVRETQQVTSPSTTDNELWQERDKRLRALARKRQQVTSSGEREMPGHEPWRERDYRPQARTQIREREREREKVETEGRQGESRLRALRSRRPIHWAM